MRTPTITPNWLSAEMAHALAAACPPLTTADIVRAAEVLSRREAEPTATIGRLFHDGTNLMQVRRVVEALSALHDLAG